MADLFGPGFGKKLVKQYYNEDGQEVAQFEDGTSLLINSPEYKNLYSQGLIYGENERGVISAQAENAHPEIKRYQQLTNEDTFEQSMKDGYFRGESGAMARGLGQSEEKFWEVDPSYKQNYDERMNKKYVNDFFERNPKQDNEDRGAYLNRTTNGLPEELSKYLMQNLNPENQTSYWNDFTSGAINTVNSNLGGSNENYLNLLGKTGNYSTQELNSKAEAYKNNSYSSGLGDRAGLLAPLNVIAKTGQSFYRDDYSLGDALSGKKNDAGVMEDIIADTAMTLGAGTLAKSAGKTYNALAPE